MNENYFKKLNDIDVSEHIESKNGLSYLSWAWAWGKLKSNYPDAVYTIYENSDGLFYHTDGKSAWVKTGVTVNGIEHIEYLPVMDNRNKSIPLSAITSFEVNKAIQRSLTKAVARHGLGLYIYAGEDLPESYVDYRKALIELCGKFGLNIAEISKEYNLSKNSKNDDFKSAFEKVSTTLHEKEKEGENK